MDEYIGSILPMAFNWSPKGWYVCHGQVLSINQYQALFALIGTTYGGDGLTTFALPELRPKDEMGNVIQLRVGEVHNGKVFIETYIAVEGIYPTMP